MEFGVYLRAILSMILVLGLMGAFAWALPRFLPHLFSYSSSFFLKQNADKKSRLHVEEMLPIDAKRRLMIVTCDDEEHLVLIGASSETLLSTKKKKKKEIVKS
ncbi:MAG: flagellar biosynthetic protein FliO [Alphaproteobacteria bacterium]